MSFLKNLIFTQNENSSEGSGQQVSAPVKQQTFSKFQDVVQTTPIFSTPKSEPTPTVFASQTSVSQEHLEKTIELYEKGFESLNQSGFDFYEFFQSVSQGGITNPQVYAMAYAMGTAMDKTISKEKLISQAGFYIDEINKVYNENVSKGNDKKNHLINQKEAENHSLTNELKMFREQMEALQIQITNRESKLNAIDGKYENEITEIDSKLNANAIAKNKIVEAIEIVKSGINTNIK
jgi:hypothetical protein